MPDTGEAPAASTCVCSGFMAQGILCWLSRNVRIRFAASAFSLSSKLLLFFWMWIRRRPVVKEGAQEGVPLRTVTALFACYVLMTGVFAFGCLFLL